MQSKAKTVQQYLASLPENRRAAIGAVRDVILENLDSEFEEGMLWGVISYHVPHRVYPQGYRVDPKIPLPFAALGSQKNYMSLYLMSVYWGCDQAHPPTPQAQWFRDEWAKTGKKLNIGKSCIRFRKLEDLPLELIGKAVKRITARAYIRHVESSAAARQENRPSKKKSRSATMKA